jgi:hypothetical protein
MSSTNFVQDDDMGFMMMMPRTTYKIVQNIKLSVVLKHHHMLSGGYLLLNVIMAQTGGKSLWMQNFALGPQIGHNVLYITLEMSEKSYEKTRRNASKDTYK